MLEEQLQAQRQAALRMGFTDKQIAALQRATKFRRAEDFLRVGKKSEAVSLMMNNWRGIKYYWLPRLMLLRLMLPNSIMRWRARVRQRKAHERYGSIEV